MKKFQVPLHIKTQFFVSNLITGILFLVVASLYFKLQPQVPLFYSLGNKYDQLVPKIWLALYPALSLTIGLVHFLIISLINIKLDKVVTTLFAWATIIIQVLLALSLFRILFIIA